jgi:hypothetical protein
MNPKALPKLMTASCALFVFIGVYPAKALSPHHSTPAMHVASLEGPQIDLAHWENSEASNAVIATTPSLPDLVRNPPLLGSQWHRQKSEIGGKSTASLHSDRPATNEVGGALLREPREGTILTLIMGEQDYSIGEPSWLFLLGTLLLASAAALFHKMRA